MGCIEFGESIQVLGDGRRLKCSIDVVIGEITLVTQIIQIDMYS